MEDGREVVVVEGWMVEGGGRWMVDGKKGQTCANLSEVCHFAVCE
jgi:hypothetical protein